MRGRNTDPKRLRFRCWMSAPRKTCLCMSRRTLMCSSRCSIPPRLLAGRQVGAVGVWLRSNPFGRLCARRLQRLPIARRGTRMMTKTHMWVRPVSASVGRAMHYGCQVSTLPKRRSNVKPDVCERQHRLSVSRIARRGVSTRLATAKKSAPMTSLGQNSNASVTVSDAQLLILRLSNSKPSDRRDVSTMRVIRNVRNDWPTSTTSGVGSARN